MKRLWPVALALLALLVVVAGWLWWFNFGDGVDVEVPPNLDPTRRSARVTLDDAPGVVITGAGSGERASE